MRKAERALIIMMSVLAVTLSCVRANAAPQNAKREQIAHTAKQEAPADFNNYRVKYTVDEVENGKTINSRSYTLITKIGTGARVRIGSRVPYSTGSTMQYQDVGMNIDCSVDKKEASLVVRTIVFMTTLAGKEAGASPVSNPVFGDFRLENSTVVTLGKPALVGSADDMASNRQYVVKVTVTKAK